MKNTLTLTLGVLFLCFNVSASFTPDSSLLADFPFDGNANDHSLFANNGITGGNIKLTEDRFGYPNSAYQFNGDDTFIEVNPSNYPEIISDFTLSFWFKHGGYIPMKVDNTVSTSDYQFLIDIHSSSTTADIDHLYADGPLIVLIKYQDESSQLRQSIYKTSVDGQFTTLCRESETFQPDTSEWYHVVLTKKNNTVTTYLNNRIVTQAYVNKIVHLDLNHKWYIGNAGYGLNPVYHPEYNFAYKGKLDDIKLFSKALTSSEISQLYNETKCYETVYNHITVYDTTRITVYDTSYVEVFTNTSVTDTLIIDLANKLSNVENATLKVYPTVTDGIIHITTESNELLSDIKLYIYDIEGSQVFQSNNTANRTINVNISNLGEKGVYFLIIMDDEFNTICRKKILLK